MRFMINAVSLGTGGGATYLYNLLSALLENSAPHHYLLILPRASIKRFQSLDCSQLTILSESNDVPDRPWQRVLWEQIRLPVIARRYNLDGVLSVGSMDLFLSSLIGQVPSSVVVQLNQPWMVPDLLPSKVRVAYLNWGLRLTRLTANDIIVMSETAKDELVHHFAIPCGQISVIYHGGATDVFLSDGKGDESILREYPIPRPYILSVSSIFTFKNYHRLIKAYALLKKTNREVPPLMIVGSVKHEHYYEELRHLVDTLELNDSVHMLGVIPYEELAALYRNATLYVFPSLCETFGLTQVEAMLCGLPILASNTSVMPEISKDAADYFDPYSEESIADAIYTLLNDRPRQETLREKGYERVKTFSWAKTAAQTISVLEKLGSPAIRTGALSKVWK